MSTLCSDPNCLCCGTACQCNAPPRDSRHGDTYTCPDCHKTWEHAVIDTRRFGVINGWRSRKET